MEHARKMAFVDPRLLDTLHSVLPPQPPQTDSLCKKVHTVPKTMQAKARRSMERLKRNIAWTPRGDLIHEVMRVTGSNVVDLVNDMLCKRKTDPMGWLPFVQQLRAIILPMELVGNVSRRTYIRQAMTSATPSRRAPTTPRTAAGSARKSLSWTPVVRRRSQMEHSMLTPPLERQHKASASLASWEDFRAVRYVSIAQFALRLAIHPSSLRHFAVDFTYSLTLSPDISYDTHYSGYGFTRLSVHHRHCRRGSVCSGARQRTPGHSPKTEQWRQRHHHQPIGYLLMAA